CAGARAPRWRRWTGREGWSASSSSCWLMAGEGRTNVPINVLWVVLGAGFTAAAGVVGGGAVWFFLPLVGPGVAARGRSRARGRGGDASLLRRSVLPGGRRRRGAGGAPASRPRAARRAPALPVSRVHRVG